MKLKDLLSKNVFIYQDIQIRDRHGDKILLEGENEYILLRNGHNEIMDKEVWLILTDNDTLVIHIDEEE